MKGAIYYKIEHLDYIFIDRDTVFTYGCKQIEVFI